MINIKPEYLKELNKIFQKYCPKAEIWAYGSRVNGGSHSGSDLDLTVKNFNEKDKFVSELKSLLQESSIPFLIDINNFEDLNDSLKKEIEKSYIKIFPD